MTRTVKQVIDSEGINFPVAMVTDKIRIDYGGVSALPPPSSSTPKPHRSEARWTLQSRLYETEVPRPSGPAIAQSRNLRRHREIFLKHADRATLLPGVNLTKLTRSSASLPYTNSTPKSVPAVASSTLAQLPHL